MKELTIEQKAKAYDKAIERAKRMFSEKELGYLFPELKESEGEMVRKEMIDFLQETIDNVGEASNTWTMQKAKEWIAWLEKQKPYGQRKECLDCQFNYAGECKGSCQIKRSEQNFVNKIELKFKVGDWIVNNISKDVFLIKSTNNGYYTLEDIKGNIISPCLPPCEDATHPWTIEDAKDGDVLATDSWLYIFKYTNNKDIIQFHCTCPINGRPYKWCFLPDNSYLDIYVGANIHPATKEQRDLLFQKMREAGYTWNEEKKELEKIESTRPMLSDFFNAEYERGKADALQSIEWSEEDEDMIRYIGNAITCRESAKYLEEKGIDMIKAHRWLESFKPQNLWKPSDVQIKALKEACDKSWEPDGLDPLYTLYEDLKRIISYEVH